MIIDHIAIRAEDIKKSAEWYKEKLGAKVTYLDDYYIRLTTHNSTIAIIDKNKYPHEHIGVLVDSIEDLPSDGTKAIVTGKQEHLYAHVDICFYL